MVLSAPSYTKRRTSTCLGANGEESNAIPCSVSFFKAKLLGCILSDHSEVDDAHISLEKVFIPIMHINAVRGPTQ
jgi:hypothetical protein